MTKPVNAFMRTLQARHLVSQWDWHLANCNNRTCKAWAREKTGIALDPQNFYFYRHDASYLQKVQCWTGQAEPPLDDPKPHPLCQAQHCCDHALQSNPFEDWPAFKGKIETLKGRLVVCSMALAYLDDQVQKLQAITQALADAIEQVRITCKTLLAAINETVQTVYTYLDTNYPTWRQDLIATYPAWRVEAHSFATT